MNKCRLCGGRMARDVWESRKEVGQWSFVGGLPAWRCGKCGDAWADGPELERFDLQIAGDLARRGAADGPALKFMRKALGHKATELAALLGVAPETVSRWETGERTPDHATVLTVAELVLDRLDGQEVAVGILRALARPRKQPKTIRIHPPTKRRAS